MAALSASLTAKPAPGLSASSSISFSIQPTVYSGKSGAPRTWLAWLPTISSSCLIQMLRSLRW
ncbi:hypothetical protein D3C72_2337080 [compost metagenome]